MDIAQAIRDRLTMQEVANFYGFSSNRMGFVKCPFHTDKTASLKIYPGKKGFGCYGCNVSGSVIDFTMRLYGLSFRQALLRLDHDFRLGLTAEKPDKNQILKHKKEQIKKEKEIQQYRKLYNANLMEFKRLFSNFKDYAPNTKFEEIHEKYVEACNKMPHLEWWLEENSYK